MGNNKKMKNNNNVTKLKKPRRRVRLLRVIMVVFLLIAIIAAAGNIYFKMASKAVDPKSNKEIVVDIPNGSSVNKIAEILSKNKLIKNKRVFIQNAKNTEQSEKIKAGKYKLSQNMDNNAIIQKMIDGVIYHDGIKITVPEGSVSTDIVNLLVKKNLGDRKEFVRLFRNPKEFESTFTFLKDSRIKTLEGFLYPSTYYFDEKASEKEIFTTMIKEFEKNYNKTVKPLVEKNHYKFYDTIIMASIVEKETVNDVDRGKVASVFYNRLDKKMRLQSDAVLQYGLPERKSRVMYKDLKVETPYNLYLNDGLPPTPIASPGIKSLKAAASPEKTDFLYFVTGTDNKNYYSKTYEEHMVYAKKYHKDLDELEAQQKKESESKTSDSNTKTNESDVTN